MKRPWRAGSNATAPRRRLGTAFGAIALVLAGMLACGDDPAGPSDPPPTGLMPDFRLVDVNPNSVTAQDTVGPRQFGGKISAWYFGQAT